MTKQKLTRDEIRAKLLGKQKAESKEINLWGIDLELRQSTLKDALAFQSSDDAEANAVNMIIRYAYVPGTNELVFEDTDMDVILGWPFGKELVALQEAVTELMGIDIGGAEEDLKENPSNG